MKKVLFVCGTFDNLNGKPSSVANYICNSLDKHFIVHCFNGGNTNTLPILVDIAKKYDTVIWFPNISNEIETKFVKEIKENNPKCLLVVSKRNNGEYKVSELLYKAIENKANLLVEFEVKKLIVGRILDPLGNAFINWTTDFHELGTKLALRILEIQSFTRSPTFLDLSLNPIIQAPENKEFIEVIQTAADKISQLTNEPVNPSRFFGNAAFRFQGYVFFTRRNIDKRTIHHTDFIYVFNECFYSGMFKPSVDAVCQLKLFEYYPEVNYVLHGHAYLKNFPKTLKVFPCGVLEEALEIYRRYPSKDYNFIGINLRGHGFLILSSDVGPIRETLKHLEPRTIPELQEK